MVLGVYVLPGNSFCYGSLLYHRLTETQQPAHRLLASLPIFSAFSLSVFLSLILGEWGYDENKNEMQWPWDSWFCMCEDAIQKTLGCVNRRDSGMWNARCGLSRSCRPPTSDAPLISLSLPLQPPLVVTPLIQTVVLVIGGPCVAWYWTSEAPPPRAVPLRRGTIGWLISSPLCPKRPKPHSSVSNLLYSHRLWIFSSMGHRKWSM